MNDQDKTSWEPILKETDLEKRLQLVRDLVSSDNDRDQVEERLLRVFAGYIPSELRCEIESSLLKLRGGSVDESGYQVGDSKVHIGIYKDTWKLNPSKTSAGQLLSQAQQWQNPQTAIWLAEKILERKPESYECAAALGVLVENNQLNPTWLLNYVKSHCIPQEHGGWMGRHVTALANALNSDSTQQWDDDEKLEAVELLIAPFCKTWGTKSHKLVDWIISDLSADKAMTALHKLLSQGADPHVTSYLSPYGKAAAPTVVSFLQSSQHNELYRSVEVGFQLGLKMEHILHALSDNPNYLLVGRAIARLVEERERDLSTELRKLNQNRYEHLKRCVDAWIRQRAEWIVRDAVDYIRHGHYSDLSFSEHFVRSILSISREFNDSSRVFAQLVNLPTMILPHDLPHYMKEDVNRLRPLLTLFGPSGDVSCDALTGLTLTKPLSFEYDDTLRFQYLVQYGRTTDGEPLDKLIVEYTGEDVGRLIGLEKERDMLLDELAYLRAEVERRRHEERFPESRKADESNRPPSDFDVDASAAKLEQELYSDLFSRLGHASEKALLPLVERGVKFQRLEPEGLLGEFRPTDSTARIYTGMIRLLASSPEMRAFHDNAEVESQLRRIAEIHEAVHGQIILAQTCDRKNWENYQSSPFLLHETIATAYTRRFISQLQDNQILLQVLNTLESMLPWEYQGAVLLEAFSGEDLRRFVLLARNHDDSTSLVATMSKVFEILHSQALLLAATMPVFGYEDLRQRVSEISNEVLDATDGLILSEACTNGLRSLSEFPAVKATCELFGGFKWPDEVQLTYWGLVARNDAPVGDTSLRLRVELIRETPDVSALLGVTDLHNTAALGLPDFDTDDPGFQILKSRIRESRDESEEDDE